MKPQSRSLLCKAIICVSICLGTFIAFKLFKATRQESDTNWYQKLDSMKTDQVIPKILKPSEEEQQRMNAEIEAFRAKMTKEERDEFDKQVEELEKTMVNMTEEELAQRVRNVGPGGENPDFENDQDVAEQTESPEQKNKQ